MAFRTVSTRLQVDEFTLVSDYCARAGTTPSALIRELLSEEVNSGGLSNIAGKNIIEYDKKKDLFIWKINPDDGKMAIVIQAISPEYLDDLHKTIDSALVFRAELQNKRKKASVPVPKKLIKVRK